MKLSERIALLSALGKSIQSDIDSGRIRDILEGAYAINPWFVEKFTQTALHQIVDQYLDAQALEAWTDAYSFSEQSKTIALIPAGNIPLVGIHDIISIIVSGHSARIKPSSKDKVLTNYVINSLYDLDPASKEILRAVDRLESFDAVIATGSNNTNRYFEHYFGKYPNLLRKNRTSVALVDENTSARELKLLGHDVFNYFGLGCRSVSKIYIPENFNVEAMLDQWRDFEWVGEHAKYHNNYMYQKSVYLVNKVSHFDTGFVLLNETNEMFSPIGVVYLERYKSSEDVENALNSAANDIQVIVASQPQNVLKSCYYGDSQHPALSDYADDVDTLNFLASL